MINVTTFEQFNNRMVAEGMHYTLQMLQSKQNWYVIKVPDLKYIAVSAKPIKVMNKVMKVLYE